MLVCPKCLAQNSDNVDACEKCGYDLKLFKTSTVSLDEKETPKVEEKPAHGYKIYRGGNEQHKPEQSKEVKPPAEVQPILPPPQTPQRVQIQRPRKEAKVTVNSMHIAAGIVAVIVILAFAFILSMPSGPQPTTLKKPSEITVGKAAEITILDSKRKPIEGVRVILKKDNQQIWSGTTDSDGIIRFQPDESGNYTLVAGGLTTDIEVKTNQTATATPTAEASATATPSPTATPTINATATPTPEATATPTPTPTPVYSYTIGLASGDLSLTTNSTNSTVLTLTNNGNQALGQFTCNSSLSWVVIAYCPPYLIVNQSRNITISINTAGLNQTSYTGILTFATNNTANKTVTLNITLTTQNTYDFTVVPDTIDLSIDKSVSNTTTANFTMNNTGNQALSSVTCGFVNGISGDFIAAAGANSNSFLDGCAVSLPISGGDAIQIRIDAQNVNPGTYTEYLRIEAVGSSTIRKNVMIRITVS